MSEPILQVAELFKSPDPKLYAVIESYEVFRHLLQGKWLGDTVGSRGPSAAVQVIEATPETITCWLARCSCPEHWTLYPHQECRNDWPQAKRGYPAKRVRHTITIDDGFQPTLTIHGSEVYFGFDNYRSGDEELKEKYAWAINHKGNLSWELLTLLHDRPPQMDVKPWGSAAWSHQWNPQPGDLVCHYPDSHQVVAAVSDDQQVITLPDGTVHSRHCFGPADHHIDDHIR